MDLINWHDSLPYLNHMIVRVGEKYCIFGPDELMYRYQYESVNDAKRGVESLYIQFCMFDVLVFATEMEIITEHQREQLSDIMFDKTDNVCIDEFLNFRDVVCTLSNVVR
jgi:hypothetical protein